MHLSVPQHHPQCELLLYVALVRSTQEPTQSPSFGQRRLKPMRRFHELLSKIHGLLSSNVAILVSVSSLMIAALSLIVAISAQHDDLYYRETLIRPALAWHIDAETFS